MNKGCDFERAQRGELSKKGWLFFGLSEKPEAVTAVGQRWAACHSKPHLRIDFPDFLTALNVNFGKGAWPLTSGQKVATGCSARRGLRLHCKPSSSVASRSGRLSSQLLEERRTTAHVCLQCHFLHWRSEDASQLATTLLVSRSTTALTAKISSMINNKDTNYRLTINSRFIFCIVIVWD